MNTEHKLYKKALKEAEYGFLYVDKINEYEYKASICLCKHKANDPYGELLRSYHNGFHAHVYDYKNKVRPNKVCITLDMCDARQALLATVTQENTTFLVNLNNNSENYDRDKYRHDDVSIIMDKERHEGFLIFDQVIPISSFGGHVHVE